MKKGKFLIFTLVVIIIGFVLLVRFYRGIHAQREEKVKSTTTNKVIKEKVRNEK